MSSMTLDEVNAARNVGTPPQALSIDEALEELLALLEEYGPVWYTEEHHHRAIRALRGQ